MWRSFFLAVGCFTIVVGMETMVVDQVMTTNIRRIPRIVSVTARKLVNPSSPSGTQFQPLVSRPASPYQMPTLNRPLGPSASGQARYSGTQSATFNRVLDPTVRSPAQQQSGLGFAGFQKNGGNLVAAPLASSPTNKSVARRPQIIQTKDWMPWSLFAAGAIIVLYTQSLGRNEA